MLRRGALLFFVLLAAIAAAQRSAQVTLPTGDFALFASNGAASGPPSDPVLSKGGAVTFQLKQGEDHLYAWDKANNDLALRSGEELKTPWQVKPDDFKRLESVSVRVVQGTQPLASGEVLIKDSDPRHSQIVDASGPATLFDVKPGSIPITVRFKGASGDTKEVTQEFTVDLQSSKDARTLTVAVEPTGTAATPSGTAAPAGTRTAVQSTVPKSPPASPFGIIFGWLVGLGIAAAVIFGLVTYMRGNSAQVSSKLEQLGVQIPKPGDQGLAQATPIAPDPIRPQPVEKIVLPDAGIQPMAEPFVPSAPSITVTEPTLISDGGIPIPLPEGETVVGREPGLGLSLTAETTVSRRHATLARSGGDVTLTDLGSSNGTFINGTRLQTPTTLRPGDSVQFGSARFQYRA